MRKVMDLNSWSLNPPNESGFVYTPRQSKKYPSS